MDGCPWMMLCSQMTSTNSAVVNDIRSMYYNQGIQAGGNIKTNTKIHIYCWRQAV